MLLFATWQSLGNDNNLDSSTSEGKRLREFAPDLIVVDEAHWGKGGNLEKKVYSRLFNKTWKNTPILGLSATPKVRRATYANWERRHLGNVGFASLVGTRLSQPYEISVELKSKLDLVFDKFHRVEPSSFRELAKHRGRNEEIVATYKKEKFRLGKTLVIAASIDHANALKEIFEREGESVVAIHSRVKEPTHKLRDFIDGKFLVAIVVGMAREGVDIPDLKTVMLAKPITSEVEFAQFIGRASRRYYHDSHGSLRTKDRFYIVDFHDTLTNPENQKLLYHFKDYFRGVSDREDMPESDRSASSNSTIPPSSIEDRGVDFDSLSEHEYCSEPVFKTLRYGKGMGEIECVALDHLRINTRQTFGIEFELAPQKGGPSPNVKREWFSVAEELRSLLISVFSKDQVASRSVGREEDVKDIDHRKWNVVFDATCGWEIVTPILKGESGFLAVLKFLSILDSSGILKKLKLEVNSDTGTHVHLGWNFKEPWIVQNLLRFMRAYESALFTLVPPSRVVDASGQVSQFCAPISTRFSEDEIADLGTKREISTIFRDYEERYHSVNLTKYSSPIQVLEVRLHGGTVEAHKILLWLSLWMNLLSTVSQKGIQIPKTGNSTELKFPNASDDSDILYIMTTVVGLNAPEERPYLELFGRRREIAFSKNSHWREVLKSHAQAVLYFDTKRSKILGSTK